jgi:hypothetical protein
VIRQAASSYFESEAEMPALPACATSGQPGSQAEPARPAATGDDTDMADQYGAPVDDGAEGAGSGAALLPIKFNSDRADVQVAAFLHANRQRLQDLVRLSLLSCGCQPGQALSD